MIYLLTVSLIWAFSFSLIKGNLTNVDSNFVAFARLLISFFLFLPFIKVSNIKKRNLLWLLLIGAIQYGIMYVSYIYAFQFLQAYEVVLFTILTPIYVVVVNDLIQKKLHLLFYLTSLLSLFGAAIAVWQNITSDKLIIGFVLMQISNISFAFGQVFYKKVMKNIPDAKDKNIFALLYLGGFITAFIFTFFTTNYSSLSLTNNELLTLIYLGVVASGAGFFLWNFGARKTNAGSLAIFNNLKIPLGIIVSVIFFSEEVNIWNITIGGLIVSLALIINEYQINKNSSLIE
ncbi:MAG: EamA family transporter [Melioribacteraceae bacterium]|nr:EamA family transporter [Melioribacteraceae bacterium]